MPNKNIYTRKAKEVLKRWKEGASIDEIHNVLRVSENKYYTHLSMDNVYFIIYNNIKTRYKKLLEQKRLSFNDIPNRLMIDVPYQIIHDWILDDLEGWINDFKKKNPEKELAKLAFDQQNIHTGSVNDQTHKTALIYMSIPIPKGQKTLDEITEAWNTIIPNSYKKMHILIDDMKEWAIENKFVKEDDYMYRNMLRGLWAKIKTYTGETYIELVKRLWEECNESIGMCGWGHLGRLANVMVGFDEMFKAPISPMEDFQNKIAIISVTEGIDKISEAMRLMEEINMPDEERNSWFEALE
jgi:hypothetical protein